MSGQSTLTPVVYKEVPGFPGYRVGDDGSLWSQWRRGGRKGQYLVEAWTLLQGGIDRSGYRKAILCVDGKRRYVRIASLVLEVFIGPCPEGMECCHQDGTVSNDRLDNLRWDTHKNNIADKRRHGTHQSCEKNANHKLTADQVRTIRTRRAAGEKLGPLAREFGVLPCTISAIAHRRLWKDLDPPHCLRGPASLFDRLDAEPDLFTEKE
jgi:hypothetical protein